MKKGAVVILNYNGESVLRTFLPSVIQHSTLDCWVIDNASTDDSILILESEFPEVFLIRLQSNFGYAGGYNWGLEELRGKYEYFILLNSDVEVTPSWDLELIAFLESNPDFAAVQPKILSWQNRSQFDYAGAGGGFLDALGYPYCRGRIVNQVEQDKGHYDDSIPVDWASGACLAIRADDFFLGGGFDAHFFAHMEEIDLCWRLRNRGRRIGYHGKVAVFHQGGATLDRSSPRKLYLNIRNSLNMIYKNESGLRFFMIFLGKVFWEGLGLISYIFKGEFEMAKAIGKGYRDSFEQKTLLQKSKKIPGLQVVRSGQVKSILWNYIVLRKRKFSEL